MKKIIFITNTMGRAGAERSLVSLLGAIDREKYELSLLSIIPLGECFSEVPEGVRILNTEYSAEPVTREACFLYARRVILGKLFTSAAVIKNIPGMIRNIFHQLKNKRFFADKLLWRVLADCAPVFEEKFDLAVAFLEGAASYYTADHVRADKKVSFLHIDYAASGYCAAIDRPYYKLFDRIFCVSNSLMVGMTAVFPEYGDKIDLFYNIIPEGEIKRDAEEGEGFTDGFFGIRLLTVGRLHYQKGYDVAIKAFATLEKEERRHIRWYVIGEGGERAKLERDIERLGLAGNFALLGAKDNPYPFFKQCDIYIHATRYEGRSVAISEAKIFKKPIIATETAGTREILNDENAILIEFSEEEIVRAIRKLTGDAELRKKLSERLENENQSDNDLGKLLGLLDKK